MNKKIGKFKLWQLIAIGLALGGALYLYSRREGGATPEELYGGTGTGAFGPIDPESGIPYAFEGGLGGSSSTGGGAGGIGETLGILGQLREAGLIPNPEERPPAEVIEVESPAPEPVSNRELKQAQMATKAVRQQLHKTNAVLHKETHKLTKLEHHRKQKHNSTGGTAHTPQQHHAPAHPAAKAHAAKKHQKAQSNKRRRR